MRLFQRNQFLAISEVLLDQRGINIWLPLDRQCRRETRQGKSGYPYNREQTHYDWLTD